jgi:hypothetical protein
MTTCFVRWFTRVCERTRTRPTFSVPGRTKHRLRKASHGGRLKVATQSCSRPASSERKEEPIIAAAVVAADEPGAFAAVPGIGSHTASRSRQPVRDEYEGIASVGLFKFKQRYGRTD